MTKAGRNVPPSGHSFFVHIFLSRRHSPSDMPFGLVIIQNMLHLTCKRRIQFPQPLRQILVNGGFADAEFFGGGADCGPVFDNVLSQRDGALFDVPFQKTTLPASDYFILCAPLGRYAAALVPGVRAAKNKSLRTVMVLRDFLVAVAGFEPTTSGL